MNVGTNLSFQGKYSLVFTKARTAKFFEEGVRFQINFIKDRDIAPRKILKKLTQAKVQVRDNNVTVKTPFPIYDVLDNDILRGGTYYIDHLGDREKYLTARQAIDRATQENKSFLKYCLSRITNSIKIKINA